MAVRHLLPVALLALGACVHQQADTAAQPLIPKLGPDANVRVEYEGGVFNRQLYALFNVKRPAYVMVAHLGGDGVVRVLFPEDARETGLVAGGKTFRTDVVRGDYDAAPGYWFMRPTIFRSVAARGDSYDGNGHGFVFMIASNSPLRFDRVSEFGLWNEDELNGYANALDPRTLIRDYANLLSPGGRYTLDYASSISSFASYSYVEQRMDCAMMSSYFGFSPFTSAFGFGMFGSGAAFTRGFGGCQSRMSSYYAYMPGRPLGPWNPVTYTPPTPPVEVATPKALVPRDGRRNPLAPGREVSSSYRPTAGGRFDPGQRRTAGGERVHQAPITPRRGEAGMRPVDVRSRDYTPSRETLRVEPGSSGGRSAERAASTSGSSGSAGGGGGRTGDSRPASSVTKSGDH